MPSWMRKTDEPHWEAAKSRAAAEGHEGDYAYTVSIFKKMAHYVPKKDEGKKRWKPVKGKTTPSGEQAKTYVKVKKAMDISISRILEILRIMGDCEALKAVMAEQSPSAGGSPLGLHPGLGGAVRKKKWKKKRKKAGEKGLRDLGEFVNIERE